MKFRAYGFLGESMVPRQYGDGGVFARVFMPEYGAYVITSFVLKLFSARGALISLHSAERTVLLSLFTTKWAGF